MAHNAWKSSGSTLAVCAPAAVDMLLLLPLLFQVFLMDLLKLCHGLLKLEKASFILFPAKFLVSEAQSMNHFITLSPGPPPQIRSPEKRM
jgi:hypothetical protein